jgi:hypothetical protein
MDEEEFDARMGARPFSLEDARRVQAQWGRSARLGLVLWGKTSGDLERQLLAPHPVIPSGFELSDFRELRRTAERLARLSRDPRYSRLSFWASAPDPISVGTARFTAWEARCEIVRRAIDYLEKR